MRPREDLSFLHVSRAYLIGRDVTALDGTALSEVAALGLTSLAATPSQLPGHRRARPRPVGDRVCALGPRHPLPRRRIHRPHRDLLDHLATLGRQIMQAGLTDNDFDRSRRLARLAGGKRQRARASGGYLAGGRGEVAD